MFCTYNWNDLSHRLPALINLVNFFHQAVMVLIFPVAYHNL